MKESSLDRTCDNSIAASSMFNCLISDATEGFSVVIKRLGILELGRLPDDCEGKVVVIRSFANLTNVGCGGVDFVDFLVKTCRLAVGIVGIIGVVMIEL